jgi:hypothetical protein
MKRFAFIGGIVLVALVVALQLVPYGRDRTNPPVVAEPQWDSPRTRQLAQRACFDCHSHLTVWPFYARIAPSSWLVYRDVQHGRAYLNFSDWKGWEPWEKIAEEVTVGDMPPRQYLLLHPEARLTKAEQEELISGIRRTVESQKKPGPD